MIDTVDNLVIIGTWTYPAGSSTLYALHLSDGTTAWQATLSGNIRSAPVYANGIVYSGWSGGDPPICINGGVSAFNAQTGAVLWTWLTNPITTPGGGGGVWGALGWDGTHLIFGTGNTCGNVPTSQGAVALNTDGSTAWSFQVDPNDSDDNDTGGGVRVQNGVATFINKNGSLYAVDAATGVRISSVPLGAKSGSGGSSTPTGDGAITVVGAGFFPTAGSDALDSSRNGLCWMPKALFLKSLRGRDPKRVNAGSGSFLKAVDATDTIIWSLPMTNSIDAYVGIDNEIAFAPMDQSLDAIAIPSGAILRTFPTDIFEGGPVIVPSGLYVADYSGHVYAMSLPPASPAARRRHAR
jgi:hypothetical protein